MHAAELLRLDDQQSRGNDMVSTSLTKATLQQAIGRLGYALVKKRTLDDFLSRPYPEPRPDIAFRNGDELAVVPKSTLEMLIRESRLLREQSGQTARTQREAQIAQANQTSGRRERAVADMGTGPGG